MNVILVGMMGSGKTVIGKQLAESLKYQFIDTDDEIEKEQGCSISEIFYHVGETTFRKIEAAFLQTLSSVQNNVISTGGGSILLDENRKLLQKIGKTIYLQIDINTLYDRIAKKKNRPLLKTANPKKTLQEIFQKRKNLYEMSDIVIDTNNLNIQEIINLIMKEI